MEAMKIRCWVPLATAVAAGAVHYGETTFEPDASFVAVLADDERQMLARIVTAKTMLTIDTEQPTPASVRAAIQKVVREETKREADKQAAIQGLADEIIEWCTTNSVDDPKCFNTGDDPKCFNTGWAHGELEREVRFPRGTYTSEALALPKVKAQLAPYIDAARRRYAEQVAARKAAEQAEADRKARAEAELKAAVQRRDEVLIGIGRDTDELARAARDGYEVRRAVLEHLANRVRYAIVGPTGSQPVIIASDEPEWERYAWDERTAPTPHSLAQRDVIAQWVKKLDLEQRLAHAADVEVLRVMRVTRKPAFGVGSVCKYTGVVVYIDPVGDDLPLFAVVFNVEPTE